MTIHVTSENYEEEILDSTEPVLIDFYADWCGPCQMLKPVIEQISEEAEHTKIVKINIDEEPQLYRHVSGYEHSHTSIYAEWLHTGKCQRLSQPGTNQILDWGIACCSSNNAESRSNFQEGRHGAEA